MYKDLRNANKQLHFLVRQLYLELCLLPDKAIQEKTHLSILHEAKSFASRIEGMLLLDSKLEYFDTKVLDKDLTQLGMYLMYITENFTFLQKPQLEKLHSFYSRIANIMNSWEIVKISNSIHFKILEQNEKV